MALNSLGEEKRQQPASVTLPQFQLADIDIEREAREAAAKVAERKVIRAGLDAWREINRAESFEGWKAIGAALAVGKAHALRVTGANAAWGRNYSRVFCDWMREHHFDRMPKSARSVAVELHENAAAIGAWRATLSEKDRRRLVHPLSNVRRWRAATRDQDVRSGDRVKAAGAAWRRFVTLMEALPRDQAAPLWRQVYERASSTS
jgi:hypothetical protein